MNRTFSNSELYPILEAYQMICENAEGRNINKAEAYLKSKHPDKLGVTMQNGVVTTPRVIVSEIRNMMPNSRLARCKFLLGATRVLFEDFYGNYDMQNTASKLNRYLKIIASDAHVDEYDNDLNGLSFQEIDDRFSTEAAKNVDDDRKTISSKTYDRNDSYRIVRIGSFGEAEKYGRYTSWCVTHMRNMWDTYTQGGTGVFYFCLKDGFENVEEEMGPGCPMDDYGTSMIAVSVNEDGSLNTCTCRWNHEHGANDTMMSTSEISEFFGVNFYETFKPLSTDEIWKRYESMTVGYDTASVALNARRVPLDNTRVTYVSRGDDGRIVKYILVGCYTENGTYTPDFMNAAFTCVAGERLIWIDYSGRFVSPPEYIRSDIVIYDNAELKSLEGMPRKVGKSILIRNCPKLTSLNGMSDSFEELFLHDCDSIADLRGIGRNGNSLTVSGCGRFVSLNGLRSNHMHSLQLIDLMNFRSFASAISICDKINVFRCGGLHSFDGAPLKCDEIYCSAAGIPTHKVINYRMVAEERQTNSDSFMLVDSENGDFRADIRELTDQYGCYKEII